MRRVLPIVVAVAALAVPPDASAQPVAERRAAVHADVSVRIWLPAGSLRLIGWDRDSIVATGTVGAGERFFFSGDSRAMRVGVEEPPPDRAARPSELTVYVPRGGRVSVRTGSASIDAADLAGAYNSVSGRMRFTGQMSELEAEGVDGGIDIDVRSGSVRARTGSGSLTVAGTVGELSGATVTGDLTVTAQGITRGRLESTTGTISFAGGWGKFGGIEIDNHAGRVDLQLPAGFPMQLGLTTVAGTISNTLTGDQPGKGLTKMGGQELDLSIGGPLAYLTVRTFRGEIVVRPR